MNVCPRRMRGYVSVNRDRGPIVVALYTRTDIYIYIESSIHVRIDTRAIHAVGKRDAT